MTAIEVLRPGILMTVQDLGRAGWGRFGVSVAGAMDPLALQIANRLVGNAAGAPALEITGPGAELRFLGLARIALGGADLGATLGGVPLPPWRAAEASAGALLRFSGRPRGARAILAAGFDVPRVLGSASADLDAGLGGGRIPAGTRLPLANPAGEGATGSLAELLRAYDDPFSLRFVAEDDPAVPPESAALFAQASFRVSDRSNRTGFRLAGAHLVTAGGGDRLSEPIAPGAIQLPPDGQPILLMADRQTVGGYPRLGHVIAVDRPKAAQLWPGDEIRFVAVSLADAHRAARARAAALSALGAC